MNLSKDEDGNWYYRSDGCGCCSNIRSESCDETIPVEWIEEEIVELKKKIAACEQFLSEKKSESDQIIRAGVL